MNTREYCVVIDVTEQTSEDTWAVRTKTLKVLPETTIDEIEQWYRGIKPAGETQFTITELQIQPL